MSASCKTKSLTDVLVFGVFPVPHFNTHGDLELAIKFSSGSDKALSLSLSDNVFGMVSNLRTEAKHDVMYLICLRTHQYDVWIMSTIPSIDER
mmetsp:Transcript_14577/g.30982  ORF Transcript_14577/g.30982 Transcript_14577/m.30982 type:complete len:93 (-) Transcript_14577:1412-1690(-)